MARGKYSKSRRDAVTRNTARNDAQTGIKTAIANVTGAQRARGGRGVRARARLGRMQPPQSSNGNSPP